MIYDESTYCEGTGWVQTHYGGECWSVATRFNESRFYPKGRASVPQISLLPKTWVVIKAKSERYF